MLNILREDKLDELIGKIDKGTSADSVILNVKQASLEGAEISYNVLSDSPSLICVSAYYKSVECFKYLANNGASLGLCDLQERALSHFACAGGNMEIINFLWEIGEKFNEMDSNGNTCLHYCTMFRNKNAAFWLWSVIGIDHSLSRQNLSFYSPLHLAVMNQDLELVKFLCEIGCKVNQKVRFPLIMMSLFGF